jgi:hypothetical protein
METATSPQYGMVMLEGGVIMNEGSLRISLMLASANGAGV